MPYTLKRKGQGYVVKNIETNREYSKHPMSKERAEAQLRLLRALEDKIKPTG